MSSIASSNLTDVACVGEIMLESIIHLPVQPPVNSTVVFHDELPTVGGAVVNVAWYLSKLGKSVRLIAPIAQNDVDFIYHELRSRRIDLSNLLITSGSTDHLFTILTSENHRSIYKLGSMPLMLGREIADRVKNCRLIALNGGRHPDMRAAFMNVIRDSSNQLIAFNPSYSIYEYRADELEEIIPRVDIFMVNSEEYSFLKNIMPENMRVENTPRLAFIHTKAQDGVQLFSKGNDWSFRSLLVRDGIFLGAGDAFLAGFISGILDGYSLERAIQLSLRMAAIVVKNSEIRTSFSRRDLISQE